MFVSTIGFAQETETLTEAFGHHQIGVLLAHTHMRAGEVNASKNRLSVPSFTLFYNYRFNETWSLGLHTDFVAEQFVAQSIDGEGDAIERERPVAPAIMLGFKPGKHFTFLVGGGVDIDAEETLGLVRMDVEYGLEITKGWEFIAALGYDMRFGGYDSFQLGVGMAKGF
ncbi:MAG: hypothetical protein ACK5NB_09120 [Flavobacteriaceae bacterium]